MVYLSLLSPFLLLCNLFWGFLNANLSKKKKIENLGNTQSAFTCSNLTVEIPEQC